MLTMRRFIANRPIRNAYIAPTAIYGQCVNCKQPFTHGPAHEAAGKPAKSKYPYCHACLLKNAQDPSFVAWLRKIFGLDKIK